MSSSLSAEDASQISILSAQYFQLVAPDSLALPPKESIIKPNVQATIYENLFNEAVNWPIPPVRYRTRVLKAILARIEESITNPDEDVRPFHSPKGRPFLFHILSCDMFDTFLSV
jgi:hypothetical protein